MAETELEYEYGFIDKRRTQAQTSATLGTPLNYFNVANLRTRLAVINGSYYTTAMLNTMTKNDMVYALRLNDDSAGV